MCPHCTKGLTDKHEVCLQCGGTGFWNPKSLSVEEVIVMNEQENAPVEVATPPVEVEPVKEEVAQPEVAPVEIAVGQPEVAEVAPEVAPEVVAAPEVAEDVVAPEAPVAEVAVEPEE